MRIAHVRRLGIAILLVMVMGAFALAGCSSGRQSASPQQPGSASASTSENGVHAPLLESQPVSQDERFGGVYIGIPIDDFNKLGFTYGDSVDVTFSNGYELKGIPYYNGFYVNSGDSLLVAYPGYPYVEAAICYGDPLWDTANLAEGDTATVALAEAGKYRDVQEAFDVSYTVERSDYASDEQFANFRALSGGKMKEGIAYRSASPVDNEYNRAAYVETLMEQVGVKFVLDLSDSAEEVAEFVTASVNQGVDVSYFTNLLDTGCVALLNLSASYPSEEFAQTLAGGLVKMSKHDGPYLVHCIEGKDRTGFVCALIEALCGATYDEILTDYMITFDNYYGINKESDPSKYEAIAHLNLDGMLRFLAHADDNADLTTISYTGPAREYLRQGGMTDEQIDALVTRLTS